MTQTAMRMALEALEKIERTVYHVETPPVESLEEQMRRIASKAITALRQALANQALDKKAENARELGLDYEVPTLLPDGSAFGVMSFPLPSDHWLYAPNEYRDGEDEPIDLPKPILTHAMRDAVVAAVRYAIRGATMRGQENDFDPDALVQNAVYALCGPYGTAIEQQPAERTADEPVAWTESDWHYQLHKKGMVVAHKDKGDVLVGEPQPLYTRPQPAAWVGLTEDEIDQGLCRTNYAMQTAGAWRDGVEWAMNQLKEKNGHG